MAERARKIMITRVMLGALMAIQLTPALAGSCDLVLRWDADQIEACFKEMKSEISILKMQLQTEAAENKIMRNNLCLLAGEVKTQNALEIADMACAELREAAKKTNKSKKPAAAQVH
jgi:hypothetical protein